MKKTFSISYKWAAILAVMVIILLSIGLLINKFFFYDYYLSKEKQEIVQFAEDLNTSYSDTEKAGEIIDAFVLKKQASVRIYSGDDNFDFSFNMMMHSELNGKGQGKGNNRRITLPHGIEVDLTKDGYVFFDFEHDDIRTQLLGLIYELDGGDRVLITLPFEGINQTADIAIQFNIIIVSILLAVAMVIVIFLSKGMTKPIIQLSSMTKKISELDFSESYKGKSNDEIGLLGENINVMSFALENALSELKTANNQLKLDIEEKEKNVQMRKTLIANISHELKTPIALVMSYSEGLSENFELDKDKKDYYLNVISKEAEHMDALVRDLLDLTELEYDAFKLDLNTLDISSLLDEVIDRYAYLIKEKKIKVELDKDDIIEVLADKKRLEQAVTNLILNAIEYTTEEGLLKIKVENGRVSIFNSGSQIPESDLERIWTSFYKSKKLKDRRIGGSGIGLSIVRAIIDKHQGTYGAYNEINGVTFWFEL